MLNPGFVCLDYQMPCSSNTQNTDLYSNPHSAMSHNSESPYMQSPQPPSRNVTPAVNNFYQRNEIPSHAQMWIQNHPERAQYNQGNSSNAPSVISNMTRYSGFSTISVNTHAPMSVNSPYTSNQQLNYNPGPLSSGSHSENIDPSNDALSQINKIIPFLSEDDHEVRMKAAQHVKHIPDLLKQYKPEIIENIVINSIQAIVHALNRTMDYNSALEIECHIVLCDALSEWIRIFIDYSSMIIINEKQQNQSNGLLGTLMNYANFINNDIDKKRLRHLFPAFHALFKGKASTICLKAAKNTKFNEFVCQRIIDTGIMIAAPNQNPVMFIGWIHFYIDAARMQIRSNVNLKKFIVDKKIYEYILRIMEYYIINRLDEQKKKITHTIVVAFFKTLTSVNIIELINELVKSGIIQRLLMFRLRLNNILSTQSILDTYECLLNVADSKELLNMNIILASQNQEYLTIPYIITNEFDIAIRSNNTQLIRNLCRFVCNASRIPGYCDDGIRRKQHIQILHYLHEAMKAWTNELDLSDDVDTCLLILYKFLGVNNEQAFNIICHDYFHDSTIFTKIIEKNNSVCIIRVLRLWLRFAQLKPIVFQSYHQQPISFYLLNFINNYQNRNNNNNNTVKNIIKLAIETYKYLIKSVELRNEIINSAKAYDLINLLSPQEELEIIEPMIEIILLLCDLTTELHILYKSRLKDLLETYKVSSNINLAQKAKIILSTMDRDNDEYIPPLANAFSYNGF